MNYVDIAFAVQVFRTCVGLRHINRSWRIAYWKAEIRLYYYLNTLKEEPLPSFIKDSLVHFLHNSEFLHFCIKQGIPASELRFCHTDRQELRQIIRCAAYKGRLDVLRRIREYSCLTASDLRFGDMHPWQWACWGGHVHVVQYFHRELGLTADDFRTPSNRALSWALKNGHTPVVEYLHREVGLCRGDFEGGHLAAWPCAMGYIELVRYIHREVGVGAGFFRSDNGHAVRRAALGGHVNVLHYLVTEVGLTPQDIHCACREAGEGGFIEVVQFMNRFVGLTGEALANGGVLGSASRMGHLHIIQYLFEVGGVSVESFRMGLNYSLCAAAEHGHLQILQYLHSVVGLGVQDFVARNGHPMRQAAARGRSAVVDFLKQTIGIEESSPNTH